MDDQEKRYLPAIDGLRAIAVASVIANHLAASFMPSGFLGVDIFFVISGFVITRSLLSKTNLSGPQLLIDFYSRRVRRILPALVVVVLCGSLVIRLFDPNPINSVITGALAIVGASNMYLFSAATDYFGGSAALNVFMHTWSLGVEEQFYLAYPLLFFLTRKLGTRFRFAVLAAMMILSLLAFLVMADTHRPAIYFLSPFRFWEISAGCLAALLVTENHVWVQRLRSTPGALWLLAVLCLLFVPASWFVVSAPLIVVSTSLLIVQLTRASAAERFLRLAPLVHIGRQSYSLYLWHWLVICLSVWTIGVHPWSLPFQVLAMFALAAASYYFVEMPFRYSKWMGRGSVSLAAGCALIVCTSAALFLSQRNNFPPFSGTDNGSVTASPIPGYVGAYSGREIDKCRPSRIFEGDEKDVATRLAACRAGQASPLLVFMGDSHAMDLFPMADTIVSRHQASVLNIAQDGCRAPTLPGEPSFCKFQDALLSDFQNQGSSTIFVIRNNYNPRSIDRSLGRFLASLESLLARASSVGVRVVYFAPAPKYAAVGPTSLCSVQWFRPSWAIGERCRGDLIESRAEQEARRREFLDALKTIQRQRSDFIVFDPFETLCGPDPVLCSPVRDGLLIYRDESHLTERGSELMATPFVSTLKSSGWLPAN